MNQIRAKRGDEAARVKEEEIKMIEAHKFEVHRKLRYGEKEGEGGRRGRGRGSEGVREGEERRCIEEGSRGTKLYSGLRGSRSN